ncbi:hypothetical protein KI688_000086 [Linnemannia hyalina]|uniref:Uncharacterized protein n=1 Tax=Linnemannia hyalina TaxID=64524 RepID=A0A9P7Y6E3_9FUNG|nr:hypothetical protein KI688_000086 [Linnemannia hyalina]
MEALYSDYHLDQRTGVNRDNGLSDSSGSTGAGIGHQMVPAYFLWSRLKMPMMLALWRVWLAQRKSVTSLRRPGGRFRVYFPAQSRHSLLVE